MSKTYYNHAFTIAFEVISDVEDDCRADDMLAALKCRVQEMEDDLACPEAHPGLAVESCEDQDKRNGWRLALIHEACGPSYDHYEMSEKEMLEWKAARNMPIGSA